MSLRKLLVTLLAMMFSIPAGAAPWIATFGQVGQLKLGMPLAAVSRVLGEHFAPPKIPAGDPTGRCFYVHPSRMPALELMIIDDRLARIDVVSSSIKTAKGVTVGDTETAVLAAYQPHISVAPAAYYPGVGRFLTVLSPDKTYGIRFVTLRGKIQYYYSGTVQTIRYIEGCA